MAPTRNKFIRPQKTGDEIMRPDTRAERNHMSLKPAWVGFAIEKHTIEMLDELRVVARRFRSVRH
jgi:hypothetical protein